MYNKNIVPFSVINGITIGCHLLLADDSNLLQCELWRITVHDDVSSFAPAQDHVQVQASILTLRLLMSYIYGAPILDVSRSHTTTQHSR